MARADWAELVGREGEVRVEEWSGVVWEGWWHIVGSRQWAGGRGQSPVSSRQWEEGETQNAKCKMQNKMQSAE